MAALLPNWRFGLGRGLSWRFNQGLQVLICLSLMAACDKGVSTKEASRKFAANNVVSEGNATSSSGPTTLASQSEQATLQALQELTQGQKELAEEQQKLWTAVGKLDERVSRLEDVIKAIEADLAALTERVTRLENVVGMGATPQVDNLMARLAGAEGSISELSTSAGNLEKVLRIVTGLDETKTMSPSDVTAHLKGMFGEDFQSLSATLKKISDMQPQSMDELGNYIAQYNETILALKTRKIDENCIDEHNGACERFTDLLNRSPESFDQYELNALTFKISLLIAEIQPVVVRYRADFEKVVRQLTASGVLKGATQNPSTAESDIYLGFHETERDINTFKDGLIALMQGVTSRIDTLARGVEDDRALIKSELAKHDKLLKANASEINTIKTSLTMSMADMEYQLTDALYKALSFGAHTKADAIRLALSFGNAARRVKALEYYDKKHTGLLEALSRDELTAALSSWRQQSVGSGPAMDLEAMFTRLLSQVDTQFLGNSKVVNKVSLNADLKAWLNKRNTAGKAGSPDPQFVNKYCGHRDDLDYFAVFAEEEAVDYVRADIAADFVAQLEGDGQVQSILTAMVKVKANAHLEHQALKAKVVEWARTEKKSETEFRRTLNGVDQCSQLMSQWASQWIEKEGFDLSDVARLKNAFLATAKADVVKEKWAGVMARLLESQSTLLTPDERKVLGGGVLADAAQTAAVSAALSQRLASFLTEYAAARQQLTLADHNIRLQLAGIKKLIPADARAGDKGPLLADLFASYESAAQDRMRAFENYLPTRLDTLEEVVEGLGEELIAFLDHNNGDVDAKDRITTLLGKISAAGEASQTQVKKKPTIVDLLHWYADETLTQAANKPAYQGQNPTACTKLRHDLGEGAYTHVGADGCSVNFRNIPKEKDRDHHIKKTTMRVVGACDYLVVHSGCYLAIHACDGKATTPGTIEPAALAEMDAIARGMLANNNKVVPGEFNPTAKLLANSACGYTDANDLKRQMLQPRGVLTAQQGAVQNMYDITDNAHMWYGVRSGSDLSHAGYDNNLYHVDMSYYPVNVESATNSGPVFHLPDWNGPKECGCGHEVNLVSPLVLDFNGGGLVTLSTRQAVNFDINANGIPDRMGWVAGREGAFLALDRDRNGSIDHGHELFGSTTRRPNGETAKHGYEALADFDDNHDGHITAADGVFTQLRLWFDDNADGQSTPYELQTLSERGVTSIETGFVETPSGERFQEGNMVRYQARFFGPRSCPAAGCLSYDVYFDTTIDVVGH